jgi:hypothetical protein
MATPLNRGGLTPKSERTAHETNDTLRDARWTNSALEGDQHRHSSRYCPNPNATAAGGPEPSGVQRSVTRRARRLQPRVKPRLKENPGTVPALFWGLAANLRFHW